MTISSSFRLQFSGEIVILETGVNSSLQLVGGDLAARALGDAPPPPSLATSHSLIRSLPRSLGFIGIGPGRDLVLLIRPISAEQSPGNQLGSDLAAGALGGAALARGAQPRRSVS